MLTEMEEDKLTFEVVDVEENDLKNIEDSVDFPVLNIKTTLVKPEQIKKYGNRLLEDITYEKSGSNGVFESNPKLVKFKGFELNKKTSIKIQLINKSKFSQRVSIIPPTTPYFSIKYTRKGLIAPGLSETIIVTLKPQSYIYYNDYIRIICEGDKMIIPIHAYPRMNIHMKEYVPRNIDFGTISINTGDYRQIILRNIIDVPFEYEIVPVTTCEEIKVESVEGLVDAIENKLIQIRFFPQSYGFFRSTYEFRLSEMDYQPVLINITGTCNVFDRVLNENIIKHMKSLKDPISENNSFNKRMKNLSQNQSKIILLEDDKDRNDSNIENSNVINTPNQNNTEIKTIIIHNNSSIINNSQNPISITSEISSKGISKKYKNFPSNKEREFLNYFNNVDNVIKDKEIKYKRFIGKQILSQEQINKIISDRIKDFEDNLMIKRKLDLNRHTFELNSEKCLVDRHNNYLIKPQFDFNQNDKFFKTRHYYNLFLKGMTKIVVTNRAEKRLNKLKEMISINNINSQDDFWSFMEKDWANQFNRDSEEGENKMKLKFVNPGQICRGEVYLNDDLNLDSLKQVITHENNINLEELSEFVSLERSDVEIIGYKEFKSNGLTLFEMSTDDKLLRICGENESYVRLERGDSEMTFEKLDKLLNIVEMPESYKNHIATKLDSFLFTNPNFKKYAQFNPYPETSIDYNLQPIKITDDSFTNLNSNYFNELYQKLPLSIYDTPYSQIKLRELDKSNLLGDSSLDFVPSKLLSADIKDFYIKPGVEIDEDNLIFNSLKEDEDKLILDFEKDDEMIKQIRELNKDQVFDLKSKEKINLEKYLQNQKRKWMSTLPTVLEYYNTSVQNPNNKFIL